jgi:hypothetical protein
MTQPKSAFEVWLAEQNLEPATESRQVVFMKPGETHGGLRDFRPVPMHEPTSSVPANPATTTASPELEPGKENEESVTPPSTPTPPTSSATESASTSAASGKGDDMAPATVGKGAGGPASVTKQKLT